jgi:hypothetical protein
MYITNDNLTFLGELTLAKRFANVFSMVATMATMAKRWQNTIASSTACKSNTYKRWQNAGSLCGDHGKRWQLSPLSK